MTNKDKANLLSKRHLKIIIEWGGTDLFTNCSDMSDDGVEELLSILSNDSENDIHEKITSLISKEYAHGKD